MKKEPINEPFNAEAEMWFLGCIFSAPHIAASHAGFLSASDFYDSRHAAVWNAMQSLHKRNAPIDILAVKEELKKNPSGGALLEKPEYLFEISESVMSPANAGHYADIVKEASARRRLIFACKAAIAAACDPSQSASHCIETAIQSISQIAKDSAKQTSEHIGYTAQNLLKEMESSKMEGTHWGVQTVDCFSSPKTG